MNGQTLDNNAFESIKQRIWKIQALVEKGYEGEAEAAKRVLDGMCRKYGLRIEDLLDQDKVERREFNVGRSKICLNLFVQCHAKVTGKKRMAFCRKSPSVISLELTAYQYAEILNMFNWHKSNLQKDLDNAQQLCYEAYVQKHGIYRERQEDEEKTDAPVDIDRLRKILIMMGNLNDNTYYKQLKQNEK